MGSATILNVSFSGERRRRDCYRSLNDEQPSHRGATKLLDLRMRTVTMTTAVVILTIGGANLGAQRGCLNGVFKSMAVNGTIQVCPEPNAKVPDLQKQLDAMQHTLAGNQALLEEMKHSVRSVNTIAKDVDGDRKVVLLQSFLSELKAWSLQDQKKTQAQMASLANRIDELQETILAKQEDEKTARQTQAALQGQLGDAIANLNLNEAMSQLVAIQAKLEEIHSDVQVTKDNTQAIREALNVREAREKAASDKAERDAKALDEDPNMYTRAQIMPSRSPLSNDISLRVYFNSRPPLYPPFVDSKFSIAFYQGSKAWRVEAADKMANGGGEIWSLNPDEFGDRATLCLTARDQGSGRRKEWKQKYKVNQANSAAIPLSFIPDGPPTMRLTDGEPCDGVVQVHGEKASESPAQSIARMQRDQLAQMQQRVAQAQQQARTTAPAPENFADVTAEANRRNGVNGWEVRVDMQSGIHAQLFDVHVQANLFDDDGQVFPLTLSNRQIVGDLETRYGTASSVGTKAAVCVTARDPRLSKLYRLTQRFSVETSRVQWDVNGSQVHGEHAAFVRSEPPIVSEASDTPCQ